MRYLFSQTAQAVTALILILVPAVFWSMAVREERAIALDSTQRLDDEQLTLRQMTLERDRADGVLRRYAANQKEIGRFRTHFLEDKRARLVAISAFLDERTRAREIEKDRIEYQTRRGRNESLEIYEIRMPLAGRYRDIRALISDIEASDLYLCITELALDRADARDGAVSVELTLETFFQGEIDE